MSKIRTLLQLLDKENWQVAEKIEQLTTERDIARRERDEARFELRRVNAELDEAHRESNKIVSMIAQTANEIQQAA